MSDKYAQMGDMHETIRRNTTKILTEKLVKQTTNKVLKSYFK
jgi:hypothetical protein